MTDRTLDAARTAIAALHSAIESGESCHGKLHDAYVAGMAALDAAHPVSDKAEELDVKRLARSLHADREHWEDRTDEAVAFNPPTGWCHCMRWAERLAREYAALALTPAPATEPSGERDGLCNFDPYYCRTHDSDRHSVVDKRCHRATLDTGEPARRATNIEQHERGLHTIPAAWPDCPLCAGEPAR